jgi:4-alpha-glucanotransferase
MSDALDRLAEAHGIELSYVSETGERRVAGVDTKRALLAAMGVEAETDQQIETALAALSHERRLEDTRIPIARCFVPDWLRAGRCWGIACQLYGLRSERNHGIGDFEDLARLAEIAARAGADFIGTNPLHALFWADPERCSPYSPSTRRFINPLYIALDRVEGAEAVLAQAETDAHALRAAEMVTYSSVARLKRKVLEHAFASRSDDCDGFRRFNEEGGEALRRFAEFQALSDAMRLRGHGSGWHTWPEDYRDFRSDAVVKFSADNRQGVLFHQWLQWLAAEQLSDAQRRALAAGMRIGLYLDLAVGVASDGQATWADPDVVVAGARIGAPPDLFNAKGQDWGLAPMSPLVLAERNLEPFARDVAASMRCAGAIRFDHAMGLRRLYWIAGDTDARGGGYVRYPLHSLLERLAALSRKFRAIVIGEDLGTVPADFRAVMHAADIQSYRVLYFERGEDRRFIGPEDYPRQALACLSTHDLPTLKGWWLGHDIAARTKARLYSPDEAVRVREERMRDRLCLLAALSSAGLADDAMRKSANDPNASQVPEGLALAVHRYLARTPSRLLAVQLEDLVCVVEQANLPGTQTEYPNWRRKIPVSLSALAAATSFKSITIVVSGERPHPP